MPPADPRPDDSIQPPAPDAWELLWLPEDVRSLALVVGNGERFWPITVAGTVADAMAAARLGICGGEVYVSPGRTWGNMEFEWMTTPGWRVGEQWPQYVGRGLAQAQQAIAHAREVFAEATAAGGELEPKCFLAHHSAEAYPLGERAAGP